MDIRPPDSHWRPEIDVRPEDWTFSYEVRKDEGFECQSVTTQLALAHAAGRYDATHDKHMFAHSYGCLNRAQCATSGCLMMPIPTKEPYLSEAATLLHRILGDEDAERVYYQLGELLGKLNTKGWICRTCGVFNGEEKERRSECRSCGLGRQ